MIIVLLPIDRIKQTGEVNELVDVDIDEIVPPDNSIMVNMVDEVIEKIGALDGVVEIADSSEGESSKSEISLNKVHSSGIQCKFSCLD